MGFIYRPNPRRRDTFALSLLIHIGPGIGTSQIRVILDRRMAGFVCKARRVEDRGSKGARQRDGGTDDGGTTKKIKRTG